MHASVMRLPQVHDTEKAGTVTPLIAIARAKGVSAYIGDGHNRWPAAHVTDVARLYRLALDKFTAGARYHAVAEEGVPLKDIATAIGRGLNVPVVSIAPEQAQEHFGFLGFFAGRDASSSSAQTRAKLGRNPTGPDLLTDLQTCVIRRPEQRRKDTAHKPNPSSQFERNQYEDMVYHGRVSRFRRIWAEAALQRGDHLTATARSWKTSWT